MIIVNLEKAKAIKKDSLRSERTPLLQKLDVDYIKAIEQGTETTEIVADKQRLRDITNLCNIAQTVDELKQITVEQTNKPIPAEE